MRLSARQTLRAGLVWAMWLLMIVVVVASLTMSGDARTHVVDGLGLLAVYMSAGVCWLAVLRVGLRRWEVLLSAAAVTSFAIGLTYLAVVLAGGGPVLSPSPADVPYTLFYPLMLSALAVAVHHHVGKLASSMWLDCAVGSLGAAAVLAVLLGPVLHSATAGPWSLATTVAVTYPMFDLVLVAAVAGIAAIRGVLMDGRWGLLVLGLLVFAAADVVYALERTSHSYVVGTALDAGWGIGLALVAMWVDGTAQDEAAAKRQQPRPATAAKALTVSSVATLAGLGVLVMSSRVPVSTLAVTLAGVTLLAAAARSQLAFRLLERMAHLGRLAAATDELTGLPNRRALYAEGQVRTGDPQRQRQALLMLDLDKFKEVNDSLGHRAGDQLLIQVGVRLGERMGAGDLLARLGGDEFAVLLQDAGHDEAVDVAVKLCAALDQPFAVEDVALRSSVSVGISLFPDDGPDLSTLLRKADIAMYQAKTSFTGHHVYSSADDADDAAQLETVEELRTALTDGQFVMHYQPKMDLDSGEVHDLEAVVRWDHPTRGLLQADDFLTLMEESGLMPTLTRLILAQALDQVADWHTQGQQLPVAVNLSASSLVDSDLPDQVASMLAARGVSPHNLQLEITEEFLMADRDRARSILAQLRSSGIQISVADFGSSYSSLSYLRDLPIDELKLDRSFIYPMAQGDRTTALVASTIALAHSLGLRMVADGVENYDTYTELTRLGCDQAQGSFMSRPVPAAEINQWLHNRHANQTADVPLPHHAAALDQGTTAMIKPE